MVKHGLLDELAQATQISFRRFRQSEPASSLTAG